METPTRSAPLKDDRPGETVGVVRRWEDGLTWMAHPDERMQRASHALTVDEDVWLFDPLDANGLDEELASLGAVGGVVLLSSRHRRHAERIAHRYDVSIHVPAWFDVDVDAPVEPFTHELDGTGLEVVWRVDGFLQEGALYDPDRKTLLVGDSLMTNTLLCGEEGRLEITLPILRLRPPRVDLGSLEVERVLVSHGTPIFEDAHRSLEQALTMQHRGRFAAILWNLPIYARILYTSWRE